MVRRVILGSVFASAICAVFSIAQGCMGPGADVGNNCPPGLPRDCCQCPWPEDCPPFASTAKDIPDWCGPYLIDAGCPGPFRFEYIYDRSICDKLLNDAGTDDGDAGDGGMSFCSSGTCVPPAPEAWKHVAFAMTWPALPPVCPADAPITVFEGSPAPPEIACPACSCDAPEGKCELPTKWTVKTVGCDDPSVGVQTNFDPPVGWNGTCANSNAIALDKLCGGVPCVRSITIAPPIIQEMPCIPHAEGESDLPVLKAWGGPEVPIGRACASDKPLPKCIDNGCTSTNLDFAPCIMHDGDQVCPESWNGERHVLYGQIDDSRECSPCGCDAPKGGMCQIKWRTFSTASCSIENGSSDVYSGDIPSCLNLMPGVALAGKTAELIDYTKGSCTPMGGAPVGDLKLGDQATICCRSMTM